MRVRSRAYIYFIYYYTNQMEILYQNTLYRDESLRFSRTIIILLLFRRTLHITLQYYIGARGIYEVLNSPYAAEHGFCITEIYN